MFTLRDHNVTVQSAEGGEAAATILIAEDDRRVRDSLDRYLRLEGYEVVAVPDGAAALAAHDAHRPDLLVLDVSMPNADGLSVCRMLRQKGCDTQILMLTARHEVDDRVAGLDAGADDYLVKPFAVEELLARVRARLRAAADGGERAGRRGRSATAIPSGRDSVLRLGDLEIDVVGRLAERAGRPIDLSVKEFDLLELLVRNAGVVLSRFDIYEHVWEGTLDTGSKTLDVYVGYLRRKTEAGGAPRIVHTVRGVGYVARIDR
ncbi:MAG: response regulator transcription factor [Acidimicrobiaceae bacterium]|nr:response regulator transcription factor [Acidimicrobiaceae bacterium]MXZ97512.1 response regulator transcription factor [Acidimicrobiaceae bacterium]MYE96198.1 response regulator transcription factor [Acidimicrobiaceae bacterium]MYI53427.1 response regulator transcription factor [Acidimicrobiaceae bacterium]MYJ42959.1 response regulator transcription factor [Acidimicrobiaceae bacterium]